MPVENLIARSARFATSLAAVAVGLALLTSPCPAQTALVTAGQAHPTRMENPVTTNATPRESARPIAADTIRPFEIHVPEEELVELRRRISATRWPGGCGHQGSWTMHFPDRDSVSVTAVVDGDNIITDSEPFESMRRPGTTVTTHAVFHMEGDRLVGDVTATWQTAAGDSVGQLRTESTRTP